jgi:hypothetical protein
MFTGGAGGAGGSALGCDVSAIIAVRKDKKWPTVEIVGHEHVQVHVFAERYRGGGGRRTRLRCISYYSCKKRQKTAYC